MSKFLSGRERELKIGIVSYTENNTVLEIIGNTNITGIATAAYFYGDGSNLTNITGVAATVAISTTAPLSPTVGDLWFNSNQGRTFVYYDDGSSSQWVDTAPFNQAYLDTISGIGFSAGISTLPSIYYTDSRSTGIFFPSSDQVTIVSSGSSILNINSSGIVVAGIISATSFVGDGSNLTGLSTFSGDYNDLTNAPTNLSSFSNDVGFITSYTETQTLDNVTSLGNITTNGISVGVATATSFVKSGGTSSQFLKADGSVDTSTYLTSYTETSTLNDILGRGNTSAIGISVGVVTSSGGFNLGISSAGTSITSGPVTTLNFIGAGNTFAVNGTTVDISIAGGGGGGASVSISTEAPSSPTAGDLWYNNDLGRIFIYYDEVDVGIGSTAIWVDAAPFNIPEPTSTPGKSSSTFTATEGQTEFTVSYTAGYIDVFLNGIRLNSAEYLASNGSSVTLVQAATAGDVLDVVEYRMGIGDTGPIGPAGPLSEVTSITSNSTYYPLVVSGIGSVSPYVTTTSNYFEFTPASGTLKTNQLVVSGIATATDFDSSSDLNLKENVQVIENAIDKIVGISGVTFEWKETKQVSAGVIAQDVEKVFPEVVKTSDYKTVNYNGLIGLMVEAIKEQQEQINTLTKRIEELEGQ